MEDAKTICLRHCHDDVEVAEEYLRRYSHGHYAHLLLNGLYNSSMTLVPFLSDPRTHHHHTFTRACTLLHALSRDYPLATTILQGLQALAWLLKQEIPADALGCFDGLPSSFESFRDVPVSFVVPQYKALRATLSDEEVDLSPTADQVGGLIERWYASYR
jgi:hypothetical protein